MANPYSIHLVEPLSPEVAQRVANETASQLGGTPDKLAQLLTRNSGSRIARASSAAQADRVAGILRKAGVTVQVVDPEASETLVSGTPHLKPAAVDVGQSQAGANKAVVPSDQVNVQTSVVSETPVNRYDINAGSSSSSSGGTPIVPDEIIPVDEAPYIPPVATQNPPSMTDLFPVMNSSIAPPNDPFAADSQDLFNPDPVSFNPTPASDPFGVPANDSYTQSAKNPFAPANDPFAAPANDPFAEPARTDPFAAPKSDPFAASSAQDPFAPAAGVVGSSPATQPAFDPFAQSQAPAAVSELPAQALKAQNRALPRSSISAQMLRSLIAPILLVGILTAIYLNYQIPITMQRFLTARANAASSIVSAQLVKVIPNTNQGTLKAELDDLAAQTRYAVPGAKFLAIATTLNNNKILSNAVDSGIDVKKLSATLEAQEQTLLNTGGLVEVDGLQYVSYAKPINNAIGQKLGTVYAGIDANIINDEKIRLFVPLFIGLLLIVIGASVLAAIFAGRLVRPIIAAADQANRISLGDLDQTVDIQSNDEIGDLLGSLERMRVSLKSVIGRLRRDR